MTTRNSPVSRLRSQAVLISSILKRAERGEKLGSPFTKIMESRDKPTVKVGIAMDDKIILVELPWTKVAETTEEALAEYILDLMRESRGTEQ